MTARAFQSDAEVMREYLGDMPLQEHFEPWLLATFPDWPTDASDERDEQEWKNLEYFASFAGQAKTQPCGIVGAPNKPHKESYRPDLPMRSQLRKGANSRAIKMQDCAAPGFFKLTNEERATLSARPLTIIPNRSEK